MAQQDFREEWAKVSSLEKKGLTRQALEETQKIFARATAAKNDPQQIKSVIYQIKYAHTLSEDSRIEALSLVDSLIGHAAQPAAQILKSIRAELYHHYQQENRYRLYGRTELGVEDEKDVSTWSNSKLLDQIGKDYLASLENPELLKQTPVERYDAILLKGKNTRNLRPTLFDFLAHRALQFFTSTERTITQPAYQFRITDADAFADATVFAKKKFETRDTTALYFRALQIYGELLAFHLEKNNIEAQVDVDLNRLEFVKEHGVFPNKEQLYTAALNRMEQRYRPHKVTARILFALAQHYYAKGNNRNESDTTLFVTAVKFAEDIVAQYPDTESAKEAQNLLLTIRQPDLYVVTEKVVLPQQPFKALVKYKNTQQLYFRLVEVDEDFLNSIHSLNREERLKKILQLKSARDFTQELFEEKDYRTHSVEIKINGLAPGSYLLIAGLQPSFSLSKNIISYNHIYSSTLALAGDDQQLYVLNRESGKPVSNATVVAHSREYNSAQRKYYWKEFRRYTTNADGNFQPKKEKGYRSYVYELISGKEKLFINDEYVYGYYNDFEPKAEEKTFLFTDRSLYRPAQEIFFKGILLSKSKPGGASVASPGKEILIILTDYNGTEHGAQTFYTNKFGSFQGSFILPQSALNGVYYLRDTLGRLFHTVQVEEYKRPKFIVSINNPEESYRLGDTIKVTGTASAYAGYPISNAQVTYRVKRQTRIPLWMYWNYRIFPPQPQSAMEIAYGTVVTNDSGKFTISFPAIADETIDKQLQPTFYFEVMADVTDDGGETRSAQLSVPVAYQAIQLTIGGKEQIQPDSISTLLVHAKNMSGEDEKVTANIKVSALKSPGKLFKNRYWEKPDRFLMTREQHDALFPYDEYNDEASPQHWPIQNVVIDITDTTAASGEWLRSAIRLSPGWYKMEVVAQDRFGEQVKAQKLFRVAGASGVKDQPIMVEYSNEVLEPGETLTYNYLTGFEKIWLIHGRKQMDSVQRLRVNEVASGKPVTLKLKIAESDRGGVRTGYFFVKNNRVYSGQNLFAVPWSNKQLNISMNVFRDELLPGSNETWAITINGPQRDQVAAEALISMYDASLDQFKPHSWTKLSGILPINHHNFQWKGYGFKANVANRFENLAHKWATLQEKSYDEIIAFSPRSDWYYFRGKAQMDHVVVQGIAPTAESKAASKSDEMQQTMAPAPDLLQVEDSIPAPIADEEVRTNLQETAFFFPQLQTDSLGQIHFSFTVPEALTEWKLMINAHTPSLMSGYMEEKIVTKKPLMVQPNVPRFFREGDKLEFPARIVNTTDKEVRGTVTLELIETSSGKPVDGWFSNVMPVQHFSVESGLSQAIMFPLEVPVNFNNTLTYRVVAKTTNGDFSDGESALVPVLSNRLRVTETFPLTMINETEKTFRWNKLLNAPVGGSLTHQALTIEITTNPAWYAVQSLPYLMEYPYECSEQTFNRFYANHLASFMMNRIPRMKQILDHWALEDTSALLSNLQKNPELKSVLLQETPWVLAAKTEADQRANLATLFNMKRLAEEENISLNKLKALQLGNGGFSWFKGGPDDRFITQYIVAGAGRLIQLDATAAQSEPLSAMIKKGVAYIDARMEEEYNQIIKRGASKNDNLSSIAVHYLYARSFFPEIKMKSSIQKAHKYFLDQAIKYGLKRSRFDQAMIAVSLFRNQEKNKANEILASLKDNAINHPELGMYWKEVAQRGWYWHQASVEAHSMIIAAFAEISPQAPEINAMKTWLLRNKQVNSWESTKATADACYALLFTGNDWLNESRSVTIRAGNKFWSPEETESPTGYSKVMVTGEDVQNGMGNIHVKLSSDKPGSGLTSWGAAYWQYFEDMDKITSAEGGLKLSRRFFKNVQTDRGPRLEEVTSGATLQVGDKLVMRIHIQTDRDMEYMHLKDMRPAGTEPVNVLSGYRYHGGLGYYQSTRDASTDFFFNFLPRGSHVLEYPVFVSHAGNFSTGISTLQSMYAPEFSAHSGGERLSVDPGRN